MTNAMLHAPPLRSRGHRKSEDELLRRYAAGRNPQDLEALVLRFRPLALSLARRYARGGYALDDLQQVACLGLVKALRRFDRDRGVNFTSFAVPTILGELRRFCRDTAWPAHVPRGMQEQVRQLQQTSDELAATRGRAATVADLATELGWSEEDVVETMVAAATRAPVALERWDDDEEDARPAPCDHLAVHDPGYEAAEHLASLERALTGLTDTERRVVRLRFADGLKHQEIATRLGIADPAVARVLESALATLRRIVGASPDGVAASAATTTRG